MIEPEALVGDVKLRSKEGPWTQEDSDELKQIFKYKFDGRDLFLADVINILYDFGIRPEQAALYFKLTDKDQSGQIEPAEFDEFFDKLVGIDLNEDDSKWFLAFKLIDTDGNGVLDADEIEKAVNLINWEFNKKEIVEYFKANNKKGFTCPEFLTWLGLQ